MGKPRSESTERKYFAVFAAAMAAMNSASVELVAAQCEHGKCTGHTTHMVRHVAAVMVCILELYAMAAPDRMNAYLVVERRFRRSFAYAASTKPVR